MEQVNEQTKRIFSFVTGEIKKLEGKIMNSPSDVMSEYIATKEQSETEE